MSAKLRTTGGDTREMRIGAADRIKVLNCLVEKAAFSASSALSIAELRRATGLEENEVEWIVGTTAMADMAIVEVESPVDSPLSRKRIVGYYLASEPAEIVRSADRLRFQARHLIGRAEELEAVANGILRAIPPWSAREFVAAGEVGAPRERLTA